MYKNIVSNVSPYRETSYWTSDYGNIKCHLHKDTKAYKFLSSKTYKYGIELGKFTNIVAPIVGNILIGYVVYKSFITTKPNKYNNYFNPPKQLKIKNKQIGHKFSDHKKIILNLKIIKNIKSIVSMYLKIMIKLLLILKNMNFII